MTRELCESAKKGKVCIDDLCRSNPDDTLCGFDQSLYEESILDYYGPEEALAYEDELAEAEAEMNERNLGIG